ncbi:MAG: PhoH family protein [Candidatus Moraniibacteriota bacterium]
MSLIHDPRCIFEFEEHDVYITATVLEELDRKKNGNSEVARNARQAVRHIREIIDAGKDGVKRGIPIPKLGSSETKGHLYLFTDTVRESIPKSLAKDVPDNQIIGAALLVQKRFPNHNIVVVSNDILLYTKAVSYGVHAEEYQHDRVVQDISLLPLGIHEFPETFWQESTDVKSEKQSGGRILYSLRHPQATSLARNEYFHFTNEGGTPFFARVRDIQGDTIEFFTVKDFSKSPIWGIHPRNREQTFALDALLDPDIDIVSLLGQAGTGKTLLALAAGLSQTFDLRRYTEIIMTRLTVPVGDDIGFLPGNEEEKMTPWLGALLDNLEVLCPSPSSKEGNGNGHDLGRSLTGEVLKSRIRMKSLNFMRGRTLTRRYFIIDEAQNLTPKQVKTLVTRAGPGTKVVLLGNNAQIDTPYLTEMNSGITYAVRQFYGWKHAAHLILSRCERSRLADHAEDVL